MKNFDAFIDIQKTLEEISQEFGDFFVSFVCGFIDTDESDKLEKAILEEIKKG
jgi:hypothetical protein